MDHCLSQIPGFSVPPAADQTQSEPPAKKMKKQWRCAPDYQQNNKRIKQKYEHTE